MNKGIKQFFEKDIILKILSVLIGILIWFIVFDQQNPLIERTISVPLRSNKEVLESSNISLVTSNVPSTVDVVIRGRKQRLDKVSSNDFQAFLDFSSIENTEIGEIEIPLPEYTGTQDILVTDVNPKAVKIKLENIVRKEFPISVKWTGTLPEGYEIVNIKTSPNTITLEDLESVMNNISNVAVTLDRQQLMEGNSTDKRIEIYNESGKTISVSGANVQVNITYSLSRTVRATTTVTGNPKDDYYLKDYTLSQDTVRIIGDYDVIKDINEISAEQLDISGVSVSFQKDLKLLLPENVQLYKTDNVITAQVNIQQYTHKMISIPKTSVTIFGGDVTGKIMYRILEDNIAFSVKGPGEILDTLTDGKSIRGFVDVSDISEGTYEVEMKVSLPYGVKMDDSVFVTIEAENAVLGISPTPTPTDEVDSGDQGEPEVSPTPPPEGKDNLDSGTP